MRGSCASVGSGLNLATKFLSDAHLGLSKQVSGAHTPEKRLFVRF